MITKPENVVVIMVAAAVALAYGLAVAVVVAATSTLLLSKFVVSVFAQIVAKIESYRKHVVILGPAYYETGEKVAIAIIFAMIAIVVWSHV